MKTKKLPVALTCAVLAATLCACSENPQTDNATTETSAETTTEYRTYTTKEGDTTVKPFVEAQTLIISEPSTADEASSYTEVSSTQNHTTVKQTEKLVEKPQLKWKDNALLKLLPEPDPENIASVNEYKSDSGTRVVVRFSSLSYTDFIAYVDAVEAAGYKDKNDRYHIPVQEPSSTAMFYYSFDGEISFGIYWRPDASASGQGCELVICNYNQAQG